VTNSFCLPALLVLYYPEQHGLEITIHHAQPAPIDNASGQRQRGPLLLRGGGGEGVCVCVCEGGIP